MTRTKLLVPLLCVAGLGSAAFCFMVALPRSRAKAVVAAEIADLERQASAAMVRGMELQQETYVGPADKAEARRILRDNANEEAPAALESYSRKSQRNATPTPVPGTFSSENRPNPPGKWDPSTGKPPPGMSRSDR